MSSYTLNIQVEGGNISADCSLLTADSVEYILAAFNFDESWNELYKTAIFRVGELVYHAPLEDNSCKIPFEALKEPIMYISAFGVLGNTRATTAELPIQIQNSGYTICEPSAPTPDPYNYFIEKANELRNEAVAAANESAENAEASKNNAESVVTTKERIMAMALEVENKRNQTAESASQAAVSASSAQKSENEVNKLYTMVRARASDAASAANRAQTTVMNEIGNHNSSINSNAHPNIVNIANEAKVIALGKASALCFDTEQQLNDWVAGNYERADGKTTANLKIGDNLYILELGVPDYWWDGENIQPLGAEKPDFTDFYTKNQIDNRLSDATFALLSRSDYNSLYSAGELDSGRIYFVYEEE